MPPANLALSKRKRSVKDDEPELDPSSKARKTRLTDLGKLLKERPSFSHGTVQLASSNFTLFYSKDQDIRRIDLSNASDNELAHLSHFCAAATFGRDNEDVFDETYRKARKLDTKDFLCGFDPVHTGVLRAACQQILVGTDGTREIRAELYKLNVYGPGSFFKPHQDTPRAENMFGSLVIVFPTLHEGGELALLPSDEKEATVLNFAARLKDTEGPSIAYTAFFSDVTHEVYEVKSGYRVTLTYNLYFDSPVPNIPIPPAADVPEDAIANIFKELLDDEQYLPEGGLLGFGLRYQYPVKSELKSVKKHDLLSSLKGSDSSLARLLSAQGLKPFLMAIYKFEKGRILVMSDFLVDWKGIIETEELYQTVRDAGKGSIIECRDRFRNWVDVDEQVTWVTEPVAALNRHTHRVGTYGNEPCVDTLYADLALMVRVGKPGTRDKLVE